jgi:hypothetical protein
LKNPGTDLLLQWQYKCNEGHGLKNYGRLPTDHPNGHFGINTLRVKGRYCINSQFISRQFPSVMTRGNRLKNRKQLDSRFLSRAGYDFCASGMLTGSTSVLLIFITGACIPHYFHVRLRVFFNYRKYVKIHLFIFRTFRKFTVASSGN